MRRAQAVMRVVALLGMFLSWSRADAVGQDRDLALAGRTPRFLYAPSVGAVPVRIDARGHAALRRVVSLQVDEPTIGRLLTAIEEQTGLTFAYDADFPLDRPITLRAESITVAAALSAILLDTGVDVLLSRSGSAALVKAGAYAAQVQAGSIVGRVTDAKTGEGLVGAEVSLEGARPRATTGQDGRYRLSGVEAGSYTLAVRRIGYRREGRPVTVVDGDEVTVDVALEAIPTQLDEVVTTVTGEQRLRELGHVVGRINADSLVKEAPVSSLSELLNGRVPGLQVFQSQGTVGGQVALRVRGSNSVYLNNEPIVIVDGVRYTTTGQRPMFSGPGDVEPTSPLNDLNPNDIESIEVVKGPSAATLYGTDAANGVLVITTKRGRPGPARVSVYGRATTSGIPTPEFPDLYWGWGTVNGVPNNPNVSCTLLRLATGECTQQDSIAVLRNPLNDPALTLFESKPRWQYGANLAGGRQDLRYYFAGDYETATGPVQMPREIARQLQEQRGLEELPEEWRQPNTMTKLNLRANVTAAFGEDAELRVNTGYVRSDTRGLGISFRSVYSTGLWRGTPMDPYPPAGGANPAESFLQTSNDQTDRFFGSTSGQWRPAAWLATRATVGLDLIGRNRYALARRGDAPSDGISRDGAVEDTRIRQVATTAELGATATLRRGRLSARTALGAQYVRNLRNSVGTRGRNLPPGGSSVGEAVTVQSEQEYSETVTLGSYVEETLGWNDRLFLTGALRVDGASAFGQDYDAAVYPKVSASWLVSEEPFLPRLPGLDELRLRYAYGASGQQPTADMARPAFRSDQVVLNGQATSVVERTRLGNPTLRPERVREHEFGFDATVVNGRFQIGATWYRRRTVDQISTQPLPPGLGSMYTNLGLTTQRGFELELTARVLDTRLLSWDFMFQHGSHTTTLVDLGESSGNRDFQGGWVEGYALGARFLRPIVGYEDTNGDGIIYFNEVQLGDTAVYMGESRPPRSQTLSTVVGLFERRLRLSALVERRTGFTQVNSIMQELCTWSACREAVDPSTSLAAQAEALQLGGRYPEPGDFTRLREVTAALDVPLGLVRALGVSSATLSVSARNLALWSDFTGPDPESTTLGSPTGLGVTGNAVSGGVANGIPQGRSWTLRMDLGL